MKPIMIDFNEIYSLLFFSNTLKLKKERVRIYLKDRLHEFIQVKFNVKVKNEEMYKNLVNKCINDYLSNEFNPNSEEDFNFLLEYLDLNVVAEYADIGIWDKAVK